MKKTFIIWSSCNQMGFGVEVNAEDYSKAKDLALEGWNKWNNPEEFPEYEAMGYAEPSMEMMDAAGIEYQILDEESITDPEDPDKFIKGAKVIS